MFEKKTSGFAFGGIIIALIGFIFFAFFGFHSFEKIWAWNLNPEFASSFGSLVGGLIGPIFALSGVLLIYDSIVSQRKSFEQQQKSFQIQQFETKFFALLEIHRANVSEMQYDTKSKARVFVAMNDEFFSIFSQVCQIIPFDWLDDEDLTKKYAAFDISYTCLYFGVTIGASDYLRTHLNSYNKDMIGQVITALRERKSNADQNKVYYSGHRSRLTHYLRHFEETIKFVDRQDILSNSEKGEYLDILQAQLTMFEQTSILLYSISNSLHSNFGKNKMHSDEKSLKWYIDTYQLLLAIPEDNYLDSRIEKQKNNIIREREKIISKDIPVS